MKIFSKVKNAIKNCSCRVKMFILTLFSSVAAFAQDDPGVGALKNVAGTIEQYLTPVRMVIYAIAGVVALVGAVSVYISMQNDEQDVKKKIMMTVGACIFLIAAATALPLFFGLSYGAGN